VRAGPAGREQEAERMVEEAREARERAVWKAEAAERRAEAAELAKIELSIKLANLASGLDGSADISSVPSRR
jgi:hypothetical protein